MRPRRLWSIVLSIHRCNWSNGQFGRLYDKSGVAFHSSSDSPPQAGGSLRIGIEKFSGAVFLGNLFVWRKDRKLLRKAEGADWGTKQPVRHKLYKVLLSEYRPVIGCSSEVTSQTQAVESTAVIFLSSRKSEHPRYAACRKKLCAPFQSSTDLFRSDLPILPLRETLLRKAARQVAQKFRYPFSVPFLKDPRARAFSLNSIPRTLNP